MSKCNTWIPVTVYYCFGDVTGTSIVRVCRTSNDSYLATCDTMVGAPNTCYYDVRNVNGTSLQGTTSDGFAKIPPGYTSMWVRSFFPVPTTATEQILLNDRLPLCAHLGRFNYTLTSLPVLDFLHCRSFHTVRTGWR